MQQFDPIEGDLVEAAPTALGALSSYTGAATAPQRVGTYSPGLHTSGERRAFGARPIMRAIVAAADRTAAGVAEATKQSRSKVRRELDELVRWLARSSSVDGPQVNSLPPVIAREYVSAFRTDLLAELDAATDLDAREVVRVLIRVEEAGEAWKQTNRGRFIARLTGSDCADAVVAIAHDIRSPLCSILLLVDTLRRTERGAGNAIRDRQLGLIYGAALGLSTTVSNLIDAARGQLVHGLPAPFSVTETMLGVNAIVQPMCEEKGLPMSLHFPKSDARIGHRSAIHQALLNLTSNALRYTESGSVSLGCTELGGNTVEFWIQDTGPGIPDEVLERFCYGFPPEGAALRFSSAGLGLAIVRTLVEAMGSTLQVDTGTDGTRFSFLLELPPAQ